MTQGKRASISRVATIFYLKFPVFNKINEICRKPGKCNTQKRKQQLETAFERDQISVLIKTSR